MILINSYEEAFVMFLALVLSDYICLLSHMELQVTQHLVIVTRTKL